MDIVDFRSWMTVVLIVLFVALVIWAYGRGRHDDFSAAARLPLGDDERPAPAGNRGGRGQRGGND